ncbi:N-acetyltransferase family protein [Flagellimonas sp. 2504JD1-5]
MEILRATPSDTTIIALLARITFTETFGHYFRDKLDLENYLNKTFNVHKLQSSLAKPNNAYWLAKIDGLPVGYAKLKLNSPSPFVIGPDVCQLQKIYVLKDFLSKRVGLALQDALLEEAKREASKIWLSVLKENERAVRFYEKNGFKKVGDHDFQIGNEHFKFQAMTKSLL